MAIIELGIYTDTPFPCVKCVYVRRRVQETTRIREPKGSLRLSNVRSFHADLFRAIFFATATRPFKMHKKCRKPSAHVPEIESGKFALRELESASTPSAIQTTKL